MIYILYHANCQDGLGSKYAAWKKFGDNGTTYIPVTYGQEIPEEVYGETARFDGIPTGTRFYDPATKNLFVKDTEHVTVIQEPGEKFDDGSAMSFVFDNDELLHVCGTNDVYICDFSYPKQALERLRNSVNTLVILDHHKTAQEALKDFPGAIFDMNRSGAMITWNYFHPGVTPPKLLEYVQDRDLWLKKFPETDIIAGAIPLLRGDMAQWDAVATVPEDLQALYTKGLVIDQYKKVQVENDLKAVTILPYRGYKAGVRNYTANASDIGEAIYERMDVDISMTYFIDSEGMAVVSFRSKRGSVDVGALAKEHGGGGHMAAAGMRVDLNFLSELLAGNL